MSSPICYLLIIPNLSYDITQHKVIIDYAMKNDSVPVEGGHKNLLTANEEHDNLNEDEGNKSTDWPTVKRGDSVTICWCSNIVVSCLLYFSCSPWFRFSLLLPLWFRFNIRSSLWMFRIETQTAGETVAISAGSNPVTKMKNSQWQSDSLYLLQFWCLKQELILINGQMRSISS